MITRAISGGASHTYSVQLKADEFFQVRIEQIRIDVMLKLSNASDVVLATMDSPNGRYEFETLSFIAETPGVYTLQVIGAGKKTEQGTYSIKRENSRTATTRDRLRIKSERLFVEGLAGKDPDEAITKLNAAAAGWQELGDQYLADLTERKSNLIKADKSYGEAMDLLEEETDESRIAALQKFKAARDLYLKTGDDLGEADALFEMAEIAKHFGQAEVTVNLYESALAKFRALGETSTEATTLNNLGLFYQQSNDPQKALSYYTRSLVLLRKVKEKAKEVITLNNIGVSYLQLNEYQKALRYLKQALNLSRLTRDKPGEARTLGNLGYCYMTAKDYRKAIIYYTESLPIRKALGDKSGEDRVQREIARAKSELEAKTPPRQALLPIGRTIGRNLNSSYRGDTYTVSLKQGQALRVELQETAVDVSLGLLRLSDSTFLETVDLGNGFGRETLSYTVQQTGDYLVLVLPPPVSTGGSYQLTGTITQLASGSDEMRARAVGLLAKALENWQSGGLTAYQKAIAQWQESLVLWTTLGEKYWLGYTNNYLGVVHFRINEEKKAIDYYNLALPFERAVDDKYGEATTLSNLGSVYQSLGERQEALNYYKLSLPLYRALGAKKDEAIDLSNIGSIYMRLGKDDEALQYYEQALQLFRAVESPRNVVVMLSNTGALYESRGEKQKALRYYREALAIAERLESVASEANLLSSITSIEDEEQDSNLLTAFVGYTRALQLAKAGGNKRVEAIVYYDMMLSWMRHRGSLRKSIMFAKQSVNKSQELRAAAQGLDNESQKSFLRDLKINYQGLAELLIMDNQLDQAVRVLNLYQDQRFFDFDRQTNAPVPQVPLSLREQNYAALYETAGEKIWPVRAQIDDLQKEIGDRKPTEQETAQTKQLDAKLTAELEAFLKFILNVDQEFTKPLDEKDKVPVPQDLTDMRLALRELENATHRKSATIYTLIGNGKSKLYLLLVTADQIKVFESSIDIKQFREKVWQYYGLLQTPNYDPRILGQELYGIIFKPIEEELKKNNVQTLMWFLEDILRYIPIASLWDGEKYLVERYQNVVMTRADRERMTRRVSPSWTGTGFGNSREQVVDLPSGRVTFSALPAVTQELSSIFGGPQAGGILPGEVFAEGGFNERSFYDGIAKRRPVLHISSHFSLEPGDEYRSFLLLGDGKTISLASLKAKQNLFQGVELLTLSTCDSASQVPNDDGREIDGFAELAQRLGAGSVLASLWKVRNVSTAQLMVGFYKNRQVNKLDKAQALQSAQLDLLHGRNTLSLNSANQATMGPDRTGTSIKDIVVEDKYLVRFEREANKPFAHPYYWSSFLLFGNWQ